MPDPSTAASDGPSPAPTTNAAITANNNNNNNNQGQSQDYRRSYKACLPCRQRKSRCEIGDDWVPGRPCKRCQRQMKECVFPTGRNMPKPSWPYPKTRPRSDEARTDVEAPSGDGGVHDHQCGESLQDPAWHFPDTAPIEPRQGNLSDSVMRAMISTGSDALEVLFDPIRPPSHAEHNSPWEQVSPRCPPSSAVTAQQSEGSRQLRGPSRSSSVYEVWNACRFVKQGWFSAEEAVFYVDKFYQHLQRLTPILTDFYARHENHYQLISSEPLLCCTILAVSARYHALNCVGGQMRSFFIHERLWAHIQHLLARVLLGQEKNSKGKTRSLGTIEALLLLTEWHPRSLAFPPPIDGWDSDLLVHWTEDRNDVPIQKTSDGRGRWLEDVINPAKRTGHMSWMLISCAVSLGCELGIFDEPDTALGRDGTDRPPSQGQYSNRQLRLQRLLYLYAEQISLQHRRRSILPQGVSHQIFRNIGAGGENGDLQKFAASWIDLTKLTRLIMETFYSSASQTSQLLQSGRYVDLIEHFHSMLSSWRGKYLDDAGNDPADDSNLLAIEYYSARLYCHSLCIQAVIERRESQTPGSSHVSIACSSVAWGDANDYRFVEEVVNCATRILAITIQLADQSILQYVPARIIHRVIAASIFLFKGLGVGVNATRLQESLDLLEKAIVALRDSAIDEMQLGLRYATLLDMHLSRLKDSFVASTYPTGVARQLATIDSLGEGDASITGMESTDWFALPFDTTLNASAESFGVQGFSSLNDGDLDFIWNLDFLS